MKPRILLPSTDLRPIIRRYEFFGDTKRPGTVSAFPGFETGFFFFVSRLGPAYIENDRLKNEKLPQAYLNSVVGLSPTYYHRVGVGWAVRIVFQPGRIADLFGVPLRPFRNTVVDLEYNFDPSLGELHEKLASEEIPTVRAFHIESYLRGRLRGLSMVPSLFWALDAHFQKHGYSASIRALARELGLGQRHLHRKMNEAFGLSPSEFRQLHRFNRVLKALHDPKTNESSFTRLAYQFGYYDQPHFNREFRRLSNCTPGRYVERMASWTQLLTPSSSDANAVSVVMEQPPPSHVA